MSSVINRIRQAQCLAVADPAVSCSRSGGRQRRNSGHQNGYASSGRCMCPHIVIGHVCGFVCLCVCVFVCLWVCYHDNSKLRASILTKLGLRVTVVTISSWLNFGRPAPPGRGLRRGENFWLRLTTTSVQCLRLSERFFIVVVIA